LLLLRKAETVALHSQDCGMKEDRKRGVKGTGGHYGIKLPISINFRRHSCSYRTMKTEASPEFVDEEY